MSTLPAQAFTPMSRFILPAIRRALSRVALGHALLLPGSLSAGEPGASPSGFLGRWALTTPDGAAGWLEVEAKDGWYDGSILWKGGRPLPLASVVLEDDLLVITRVRELPRKNTAGETVRTQQITETITARRDGDALNLTRTVPLPHGRGFERDTFTGRRIPPPPPPPDLSTVTYGEPLTLFNGRDLASWRPVESAAPSCWSVRDGVLTNLPPQWPPVPGAARTRAANLRTEQEFEDFNLRLEVSIPEDSNSGVYLRGIYEVQVMDSHGTAPDALTMGAIYGRIAPLLSAEKPSGEWQTLDITLIRRHVTVVLNGRKIIDNQPLAGCTGGALWSDEFRPGPIYLQGDHGPVSYRNLVLRPVLSRTAAQ
jgi:hypothetical protein